MTDQVWYVDRSRYEEGHRCQVARFLGYHFDGFGIRRSTQEMPLATGSLTHHIVEDLNKAAGFGKDNRPPVEEVIESINKWCFKYYNNLLKVGFADDDAVEELAARDWRLKEQALLGAGLGVIWWKYGMPEFYDTHEMVSVEQEYPLEIPWSIKGVKLIHEVRPDLVVRRKSDKKLIVVDFKTQDKIDEDGFANQWVDSIQMAVQAHAVEQATGEQVEYAVIALEKGQRKADYNSDTREYDGPKRQQSPFCYLYYMPAQPPLSEAQYACRFSYKDESGKKRNLGKLWSKHPTWELPIRDELFAEKALELLAIQEKCWTPARQLTYAGPYQVNRMLLQNYLLSVATNEESWYRRVVQDSNDQKSIFQVFPASFACVNLFGRVCSMHHICYRETSAADDPMGSGEYQVRRPHHEGELIAQRAAGIVAASQWDD